MRVIVLLVRNDKHELTLLTDDNIDGTHQKPHWTVVFEQLRPIHRNPGGDSCNIQMYG